MNERADWLTRPLSRIPVCNANPALQHHVQIKLFLLQLGSYRDVQNFCLGQNFSVLIFYLRNDEVLPPLYLGDLGPDKNRARRRDWSEERRVQIRRSEVLVGFRAFGSLRYNRHARDFVQNQRNGSPVSRLGKADHAIFQGDERTQLVDFPIWRLWTRLQNKPGGDGVRCVESPADI